MFNFSQMEQSVDRPVPQRIFGFPLFDWFGSGDLDVGFDGALIGGVVGNMDGIDLRYLAQISNALNFSLASFTLILSSFVLLKQILQFYLVI